MAAFRHPAGVSHHLIETANQRSLGLVRHTEHATVTAQWKDGARINNGVTHNHHSLWASHPQGLRVSSFPAQTLGAIGHRDKVPPCAVGVPMRLSRLRRHPGHVSLSEVGDAGLQTRNHVKLSDTCRFLSFETAKPLQQSQPEGPHQALVLASARRSSLHALQALPCPDTVPSSSTVISQV